MRRLFIFDWQWGNPGTGLTRKGTQVTETPDKATPGGKEPEAAAQGPSSRMPTILVSLSALAIVGAATANALPNFHFSLPSFNRPSLPSLNGLSLPNVALPDLSLPNLSLPSFSWPNFSWPSFSRVSTPPPRETVTVRIPDPVVSAILRDIQSSQQQNTIVLASLTQSSATQQADLRKISRQISSLATQVDALQGAVAPLTTSSIPRPKPRARVLLTSRKSTPASPPPLPKPVGPVSVGGAPLGPAPAAGAG